LCERRRVVDAISGHRHTLTGALEALDDGGFLTGQDIGFDQFWKRKEELLEALEKYRARRAYHFSALMVTDVTRQNSLLMVVGDEDFIRRVDYPRLEPGIFELQEVVSRKKQLLPYLTHCLKET